MASQHKAETLLDPTAVDEAYDHLSANYLHHKGGASEPWSLYFEGVAHGGTTRLINLLTSKRVQVSV